MVTLPTEVREYGCVLCQTWHREPDVLYAAHLWHQSKHGPRTVRIRRDSVGRELYPVRRPDNTVVWK